MKGKELPSVTITCKCRYGCKTLSKEYRDQLFMEFYKISYKDQRTYLLNRMQVAEISHHDMENMLTLLKADVRLLCTIQYPMGEGNMSKFVAIHSKTFLVCQLGVFKLCNTSKSKENSCMKIDKEKYQDAMLIKKSTVMMIGTLFNVIFCHSLMRLVTTQEKKSKKEYLSPDHNRSRLYTAFKKQYPQSNHNQSVQGRFSEIEIRPPSH
ncbi:hypothetical protein AVEN_219939-1 [Araneus ventricosus]|uniref:Uncharacterized protein n=1 Tax=Araneus ventricosus TaxID=182803 RepID=A0A4Y2LL63_ARAVE|nr:hypothetical protein AVEN_219939-1 [Araneus ventricosus]